MSQTSKSSKKIPTSDTKSTQGSAPDPKADSRLNKRLKDMPIAIVGMASIFANSRYLNKFWDLISEKIDAITELPSTHWQPEDYFDANKSTPDKSYCKRGGFLPDVDFNPMEFGLPPNILELTDTSQLLSLIVAKEVLADANLPEGYDRDKIGITLGVGGGQKISHSLTARLQYPVLKKVFKNSGISDTDSEMLIKKFQDQYVHWEENSFPGSLGNVISGRIANRFDFGGMNCVVDAACAGSLAAMRMALSELVDGRSEMMITGGVCTDNSPSMYMSFSKTPAFTTNETIQPFDIDSKGMMIGEGIGMIALKRLEDAERDGDRIYSVIKGVGSSSDGKFKSIYAPRPEGQAKALKRAYDDAGFAPHTLGLIEAHGTGTAAGDAAEFAGLSSVFSEGNDTKQHIALGSVKSQIGHTKSTAGTAGLIKASLALHHKVLPATINVSEPSPKLDIENSPFYLNTETRPWLPRVDGTPRRAGISSFGFGGTNFHFVLEEYQNEHSRIDSEKAKYRQRQVAQSFLISAVDNDALIKELNILAASATQAEFNVKEAAVHYALRELDATSPRIGFVVNTNEELSTSIKQAIAKLANKHDHSAVNDSWQLVDGTSYRAASVKGKVAALFAGQGSQYLNMGRDLACYYPEIRQQLVTADNVFAANGKTPLSQTLYPKPVFNKDDLKTQEAALTNTANAQSAIGAISMGQYDLLTAAGFNADMVAGHSFGELSALCAAGVISSDDYYQLAFARGHAMATKAEPNAGESEADTGAMYAIITKNASDLATLESTIASFDGVKVANYNAPTQSVIAGPTMSTANAAKALSELGYRAINLPVSGAFHTELVGHAQAPFAKAIDAAKFTKASRALYSNATGTLYDNTAAKIKASFKQHMLQSVRFTTELESMYDAGARVFVEFGPKNILQKLVQSTLAANKHELCIISINPSPKGNSDLQLKQAAIQLAVAGIQLGNVDPYQADIAKPAKASPMNITLNAVNHISQSTRAKMAKSLATGMVTSSTIIEEKMIEVEKIVEKIVEVPTIVEKIVEIAVPMSNAHPQHATETPIVKEPSSALNHSAPTNTDTLTHFFAAQQQAAELHQQFLAIPQQYGATFTSLMTEQTKLAGNGIAIPESLQRSMEQFHQLQAQTVQSHTQFLELQTGSNIAALGLLNGTPAAIPAQPVQTMTQAAPAPVTQTPAITSVAAPIVTHTPQPVMQHQAATVEPIAPIVQPAPVINISTAKSSLSVEKVQSTMLAVVAEKTGYPTEMLELEMDMEADLGIDSIKRVEILGTVQDELPALPELSPEDLAECRTLGEIVAYMNSKLPTEGTHNTTAPIAPSATTTDELSAEKVQATMMSVVADKTGYPTEMLELEMDMEADLGIDSIKRVEILGTVQDELPDLPELSPEDLAECRTLGEIVAYMNSTLASSAAENTNNAAAAPHISAAPVVAHGLSAAQIQSTMMSVVADKTGYPTEMLELSMDMEADLGIDSIKRVEILGTVQDELPGLPELSPEDLAECRTLGEIVAYMNSTLASSAAENTNNAAAAHHISAAPVVAHGLSAAQIQSTMMSVVADKTGYPTEMLELSMDMEADLGIDSIKRVEILGTVQDELPGLPELSPEDLAECRTLGEIVAYMNSTLASSAAENTNNAAAAHHIDVAPVVAHGLSAAQIQSTMMSVVADKTGYPTEMLELSMDMEADLGIDSIKRVEILGTVQDELPGLPELNPEDLAECRTLGEIVNYMNSKLSVSSADDSSNTNTASAKPSPISAKMAVELPPHSEVALKKLNAVDKMEAHSSGQFAALYSKNTNIVITDDGHNAGVLAEKLTKIGLNVAVVRLPEGNAQSPLSSDVASFQANSTDAAGMTAVIAQIEQQLGHIGGFIHLQPEAGSGNQQDAVNLSDDSFTHVSQAFLWAKLLQPQLTTTSEKRQFFITVSRIDGGFGYLDTKQLHSAELNQAALAGLTKTLSHEWPNVFCRALDIATDVNATDFADAITLEIFDVQTHLAEVGISTDIQGDLARVTLIAADASIKTAKAELNNTDTILVTGGAKGVTFECALALASRTQSHFILAGRSELKSIPKWATGKQTSELKPAAIAHIISTGQKPTPKQVDALIWPVQSCIEINAALEAFDRVGASAEYISMDVTDTVAITASLCGKGKQITGLIHGAGVLADKHIQDKTLNELARVYGTKVNGLKAVLAALDASKLKLLAMFSSAAGFYGNTGQSDYAMSNDILNKAALQFSVRHPQAKVMSFNWGPWDGGMVSPSLKKMFTDRGVYVIPLNAGAELFATQLLSETGVQLLIGTSMQGANTSESNNTDGANKDSSVKKLNAGEVQTASRPLMPITVTRSLNPHTLVFIQDHCIGGNPVLPTVCAIQWMREVASEMLGSRVKVLDYKLLKGIVFDSNENLEMTLELTPLASAASVNHAPLKMSALISSQGRPQYRAILVSDECTELAEVKQFIDSGDQIITSSELYSNGTLFHGPRLQGIQHVSKFDDSGLVASCKIPLVNNGDCGQFSAQIHLGGSQPFAEDLLLQAMLVWARLKHDAASLPSSIDEFISNTPMVFGETGIIELEVIKSNSRSLVANVALYHEDGQLSAIMKGAKVTISKGLNDAFLANKAPLLSVKNGTL
ncbi:KR domain-containing protein [Shewanella sp. VB17]|uniref:type I polyketide synthase n=1 Tax=Shewanella sp. VB17 TaxID=2739432 RepID=UPI00156476EA|nr:type I polyketide synthase [Shewanella sp. VB17]NRD74801.1 KR domain-containing protein [Shewanella sp. VB17]